MNKKTIICSMLICIIESIFILYKYRLQKEPINKIQIYIVQKGVFKNKNNAIKSSLLVNNCIIEENNNLYYVYVGVTSEKENIENILNTLNIRKDEVYVKTKLINTTEINKIKEYDSLLKESKDINIKEKIINDLINLYKEVDNERKENIV